MGVGQSEDEPTHSPEPHLKGWRAGQEVLGSETTAHSDLEVEQVLPSSQITKPGGQTAGEGHELTLARHCVGSLGQATVPEAQAEMISA